MQAHLKKIFASIQAQDGKGLAQLLSFRVWDKSFLMSIKDYVNPQTFSQRTEMMTANCARPNDPWLPIVSEHTRACICLKSFTDPAQSFEHLEVASKKFLAYCVAEGASNKSPDKPLWVEPVFNLLLTQLRSVASLADTKEPGYKTLGACLVVYREFFKVSMQQTKRTLVAAVIGNLRVYFKIRKYDKCTTFIQHVPNDLSSHPISQQVTYNFYSGCIAMFKFDIVTATKKLSFAYEHCSRKYPGNIRLILKFLIPLRLLEGKQIPTHALLTRYSLKDYYKTIIDSYKKGDIHTLRASIQQNQMVFIKQGVYLILEKLIMLAFRNLFKATFEILQPDNNLVTMVQFHRAVNFRHEMDIDEVECMVANLIYRKYIRGYIARKEELSAVKLDKTEAFPPLSKVFPQQTL